MEIFLKMTKRELHTTLPSTTFTGLHFSKGATFLDDDINMGRSERIKAVSGDVPASHVYFPSSPDGHHDRYTSIFTCLARNGMPGTQGVSETESTPRVGVGGGDVDAGAQCPGWGGQPGRAPGGGAEERD